MDREEKEKMIFLFKSASNLLDSVEESKDNLDRLIDNYDSQNSSLKANNRNLNNSIEQLNSSIVNINKRIQSEVESKSYSIADKIVNHINANFKEANKYANDATELYKNASNSIVYKVFFTSLFSFIFFTGIAYFGYTWYLQDSIKTLENENMLLKYMVIDTSNQRYLLVKSLNGKVYDINDGKYIIAVDKEKLDFK
ncbi:hypothetical protein Q6A89_06780 [Aliarcobacter skirrowii]|uniref:hypothetical protein n=1 Tax=Aliarcobacter skirrowii TaxID=28200 RepID=UPI0029BB4B37|nr:hypothetical protein [Aliarcobacter skirrowii]MDX4060216.1 hypothetical protein [Aliarcobacter skirrowii]